MDMIFCKLVTEQFCLMCIKQTTAFCLKIKINRKNLFKTTIQELKLDAVKLHHYFRMSAKEFEGTAPSTGSLLAGDQNISFMTQRHRHDDIIGQRSRIHFFTRQHFTTGANKQSPHFRSANIRCWCEQCCPLC